LFLFSLIFALIFENNHSHTLILRAGSLLKKPGFLYCWSTFFFGSIVIFLFNATRTSRWKIEEDVVDEKDTLFNVRLGLGVFFCLCCCCSCCFYTSWHLAKPLQTRDLELQQTDDFVKSRPMF